ncbi:MAG: DUF493 domain-containing protein [Proteobacteria bacterium]|nr:DUF493 domain-containing protein [Pseudomonadota bacterium]NDC23903.1 DUF493 domain-containing protein [Pseudomonadota bacterium]NDD05011.1 DUF493 domain-containing protein [Pseudomonadota bacterium]
MTEKHRFPPLELLKATHRFPGNYTFKVIGENENNLAARVVETAYMAAGPHSQPRHTVRETDSGKHIAVTLEVTVETAELVVRIYEQLVNLKGVILVL